MNYGIEHIRKTMKILAELIDQNRELLTSLDAAMGDGDLGIYMAKGFRAAADLIESMDGTPDQLLISAGRCFSETAPSTLGTLIGTAMVRMGKTVAGHQGLSISDVITSLRAGCEEIEKRGRAKQGDKTILDSIYPAIEAMKNAVADGKNDKEVFEAGAWGASAGEEKSRDLIAVHGRPAYFGEKTKGMRDGGASTGALIFQGLFEAVK
jgi:dihydroxyacetone kinase-like protein